MSAKFIPEGWQPLAGGQRSATTGQEPTREETDPEGVAARIWAERGDPSRVEKQRNRRLLENPGCAAQTGANGCHPFGMGETGISFLRCDSRPCESLFSLS